MMPMSAANRVSEVPLPAWFTDELTAELDNMRCPRKADRKRMSAALQRLAEHYGAVFESNPSPLNSRSLTVYIRLNDAYVMIHLDGDSLNVRRPPGDFLGHWNIESHKPLRYDNYFGVLNSCTISFHRNKATLVVRGFGQFMLRLAICLGSIQDRTAFE